MLFNENIHKQVKSFNERGLKATAARVADSLHGGGEAAAVVGEYGAGLDGGGVQVVVTLYDTDILVFSNLDGGTILVNHGGHNTPTTRKRINQAADHFGLPIHVTNVNRQLNINVTHEGKEYVRKMQSNTWEYGADTFTVDPTKW
jgi:hypothetical protein